MFKKHTFSNVCTVFFKVILTVFIVCVVSIGCGKGNSTEKTMDLSQSPHNELIHYLGMEMEETNNQLEEKGFSCTSASSSFEGSDYRSIYIIDSNTGEFLALLDSQKGEYVEHIDIYDNAKTLSIMGISVGMPANEAIEILREDKYIFNAIHDSSDEEKGDYQTVFYRKNGVYQIGFEIYAGEEMNPYGSVGETDIHMDGVVGSISSAHLNKDKFMELVNIVGERSGGHSWLVENINTECVGLTSFIVNDSFNVSGISDYGTYIFGENVITVDLQPGKGNWPYVTRISISDICPYKLCGIYYNMNKESAMAHMSELGITARDEADNCVIYDIDAYTTLEIHFANDYVCFIECIDDYPENHEKRYIED